MLPCSKAEHDLNPWVWVTYLWVLAVAKVIPASLGKIDMGIPLSPGLVPIFWGLTPCD